MPSQTKSANTKLRGLDANVMAGMSPATPVGIYPRALAARLHPKRHAGWCCLLEGLDRSGVYSTPLDGWRQHIHEVISSQNIPMMTTHTPDHQPQYPQRAAIVHGGGLHAGARFSAMASAESFSRTDLLPQSRDSTGHPRRKPLPNVAAAHVMEVPCHRRVTATRIQLVPRACATAAVPPRGRCRQDRPAGVISCGHRRD